MAKYHFAEPSVVDEIDFVRNEKGGLRAYLHANDKISKEKLGQVVCWLRDHDLEGLPFIFEGKPTLEVRGKVKSEKLLVHKLKEAGFVSGEPKIEETPADKMTFMDQFRKRSLQASGVSYLVGDYGFFNYGMKEADKLTMTGAFFYFLGTLSLVFYGRNDQSDLQVKDFANSLEHFLTKERLQPPPGSCLYAMTQDKEQTTLEQLEEFCKRYPSEIFNTVTALAGVFVAASAYKNKVHFKPAAHMDAHAIQEMRHEGWLDFGLGSMTTVSGLLATFVKEKKPDPDDPPAKGINWVWQKVHEHPLAIAGAGYTVSTMFHAASTFKAYREAKRVGDVKRLASVPNRALFVGAAFLSEFLLAISSKGHGDGVTSDDSVKESVYAMAAEMITKEPPETREWHIQHMCGFLQQPKVLAEAKEVVEKRLREQVAIMEHNPWNCSALCPGDRVPPQIPVSTAASQVPTSTMQPTAVIAHQPALAAHHS